MRDVTGLGCNKAGAPQRPDLPLHDLTGGNTTMPELVLQLYPAEVDPFALVAGTTRAMAMLQKAVTMELTVTPNAGGFDALVHIVNETGHKLPSGYPEGRRIWINLKAYDAAGTLVYESGAYDPATGVLTHDADAKIYEIKPGISADLAPVLGLDPGPSFHFVLNHEIFKDNRIPPRGFTNANFEAIQSPPVGYTYADTQHWDDTDYQLPPETDRVTATLYYQTTSKEYVEFLRDANLTNHWGQTLYDLWAASGKAAPEVMAEVTWSAGAGDDTVPPTAPSGLTATAPSSSQVDLNWTASTDEVGVTGYTIYRDGLPVGQAADTAYRDAGLQPETTYTYYVTAHDAAGNVSNPSNTVSATTKKQKGGGKPR